MLERGLDAKFAKSVFYEHVNDIDIYVEDKSDLARKIISILLTRALGGRVRVDTIFPLGGRGEVIDACISNQSAGGRAKLFIIDGDFSCLGCYSYPKYKFLFTLPRYCTENFLIDADAFLTIMFEEDESRDLDALEAAFDFGGWLNQNRELLARLFSGFAVTHCLAPDVPTVKRPVRHLVGNVMGNLDPGKVQATIDLLRIEVEKRHPPGTFDAEFGRVYGAHFADDDASSLRAVSGKDYLLPLLLMRLRAIVPIKSTNASVQLRLAQRGDISDLQSIQDAIASIAA